MIDAKVKNTRISRGRTGKRFVAQTKEALSKEP